MSDKKLEPVSKQDTKKQLIRKPGEGVGHFFTGKRKGAVSSKCNGSCNGGSCK